MVNIANKDILIETPRLIVRHFSEEYLEVLANQQKDPDLMRFFGGPRTDEKIKWSLDLMYKHYQKHGFSQGAAFEKQSGQIIGRSGLIKLDLDEKSPYVETITLLMPQFWCQGFGLEIRRGLIKHAFENFGVQRVYSTIDPLNTVACHISEKLGMKIEREGYYKTLNKIVRYYYIDKL